MRVPGRGALVHRGPLRAPIRVIRSPRSAAAPAEERFCRRHRVAPCSPGVAPGDKRRAPVQDREVDPHNAIFLAPTVSPAPLSLGRSHGSHPTACVDPSTSAHIWCASMPASLTKVDICRLRRSRSDNLLAASPRRQGWGRRAFLPSFAPCSLRRSRYSSLIGTPTASPAPHGPVTGKPWTS